KMEGVKLDPEILPFVNAAKDQLPSLDDLLLEVNHEKNKSRKRHSIIIASAISAISLTTALIIDPVLHSESYSTTYAQSLTRKLSDGSSIVLNTNSKLLVQMRLRSRQMILQQGEASFTVAHGIRQFTVKANQATIRDIGTVFDVQLQ